MPTIDFDINFLNFEDPDIFEKFTAKDFEKLWKTTYGMDYIIRDEATGLASGKYPEHCLNSESRWR